MQHHREEDVEEQWRKYTPLAEVLLDATPLRAYAVACPHTRVHTIVDLADYGHHAKWNAETLKDSHRTCSTPNHSEHTPSSVLTRACIPSWTWQTTDIMLSGTPKRSRTVTEGCGRHTVVDICFVRSTKHLHRGWTPCRCPVFFSRHAANIMSMVKYRFFLWQHPSPPSIPAQWTFSFRLSRPSNECST